MVAIVENIAIVLLTIIALLACGYLALVLLNWGLKLKSGGREEDGLLGLWTEALKKSKFAENSDPPTKDH